MKLLAIGVAAVVLALDLLTKWWVKNTAWLHYYKVIDGFFTIHFVRNEGIAFGLFHSNPSAWKPVILSFLAVAAAIMVLYYIWTSPPGERGVQLFLGLLLGGILGNFCDRLSRGYVVDFLEFHWQDRFAWPTFNLADAAITCGVAAILYQGFFGTGSGDRAANRPRPRNSGSLGAILLAGMLSAPLLGQSSSPGAQEIVDRIQERYEQVESFAADFRQVFQSQGVYFESDWGEGILLMKRPGKMYWEYQRPTRKLFVADGKQTFFYVPSENQVTISDLDPETADTPLLFLLGPKRIRDDFLVQFETGEGPLDESNLLLRLTPIRARPEFSYLLLELSPEDLSHPQTVRSRAYREPERLHLQPFPGEREDSRQAVPLGVAGRSGDHPNRIRRRFQAGGRSRPVSPSKSPRPRAGDDWYVNSPWQKSSRHSTVPASRRTRCDSVTYSGYAPSSRLVRRAQELSVLARLSPRTVNSPWQKSSRHSTVPASRRTALHRLTYSRYAPSSRLVRRAQEQSRCSRDFHHGLLRRLPI